MESRQAQLLQTCRSLYEIALALDTRGYTESRPSEGLVLTLPPMFSIDVLDSTIEAESLLAVVAFFCGMATCACKKSDFYLCAWECERMVEIPNMAEYVQRWGCVRSRVREVL